jgi:hypothetical protein
MSGNIKRDRIIIPKPLVSALLWHLHNHYETHPTRNQQKITFQRSFHAMDLEKHLDNLYRTCYKCQVFHKLPKDLTQQETKTEVSGPHECFHADVIKRSGQIILVITDHFSSLTNAVLIESEKAEDLKHGLITLTPTMRKPDWICIKVDNAPGFQSLVKAKDKELLELKIKLDLTEEMNKNANAVVDKRCQELEEELKKLSPEGSKLSQAQLTKSVLNLNRRLRRTGNISAFEIHTSRDINTGINLNLDDAVLRGKQLDKRNQDNLKTIGSHDEILVGDTVTLRINSAKHSVQDMFIVTGKDGENVKVQKVLHPLISGAGKLMGKVYMSHEKRLRMVNRPEPVNDGSEKAIEPVYDGPQEDVEKEHAKKQSEPEMPEAFQTVNWSPINPDFHTADGDDDEDGVNDKTDKAAPPEVNLITFEEVPDRDGVHNMEDATAAAIQVCPFDVASVIQDAGEDNENGEEHAGIVEQVDDAEIVQHDADFQAVVFEQLAQDDVDINPVQKKLKRSAPVKKRPEHWVVRPKNPKTVRKSRRLASKSVESESEQLQINWLMMKSLMTFNLMTMMLMHVLPDKLMIHMMTIRLSFLRLMVIILSRTEMCSLPMILPTCPVKFSDKHRQWLTPWLKDSTWMFLLMVHYQGTVSIYCLLIIA